jgi:uncharacterized iron-regulated protein
MNGLITRPTRKFTTIVTILAILALQIGAVTIKSVPLKSKPNHHSQALHQESRNSLLQKTGLTSLARKFTSQNIVKIDNFRNIHALEVSRKFKEFDA